MRFYHMVIYLSPHKQKNLLMGEPAILFRYKEKIIHINFIIGVQLILINIKIIQTRH